MDSTISKTALRTSHRIAENLGLPKCLLNKDFTPPFHHLASP